MQFTPLTDFFSEELSSQYCAGLSYTVRDIQSSFAGPAVPMKRTPLYGQVQKWLKEGKVRLGLPPIEHAGGKAKVSGTGEVQNPQGS